MKKTQILLLIAGYTLAFGYYGCKKTETPAVETADAETVAVEATVQAGTPAPAYARKDTYFKIPNHKGGEIDLAAYAGKPVMVMFFTERCPYCRVAAPFIEQMSREYAPKGLKTVGICLDETSAAAAGFANDFKLTFPVAYKGREAARRYRTQGVPFIYLLTKDHVIHNVWAGYDKQFDAPIKKGIEEII